MPRRRLHKLGGGISEFFMFLPYFTAKLPGCFHTFPRTAADPYEAWVNDQNPHDSPDRLDTGEILASVGEALYRWDIASDALTWSANAGDVLSIAGREAIATGKAFAQFLYANNLQARFDAVMRSEQRDEGRGVIYRVQYCIRPDPKADTRLWLEDAGQWFAGADGKPARAHGTVHVINTATSGKAG